MRKILVLGAGRSSGALIDYLITQAPSHNWFVSVGDTDVEQARAKVNQRPHSTAIYFDVNNADLSDYQVSMHDVVVSLLPPGLHELIAKDCLRRRRPLINASYVSPAMRALDKDARKAGVLFMCEMGLDPGIDHMSAMQIISEVKKIGGEIESFKSHCGGLVAPASDDNPWHYKVSWNPRNIVLAGQGTARYMHNGQYKYIPYNRLFEELETVSIKGYGRFEAYANRDSLAYMEAYGLRDVPTILRTTLRKQGFCKAWNALIQLGYTDDSFPLMHTQANTFAQVLHSFLPPSAEKNLLMDAAKFLKLKPSDDALNALQWLGVFDTKKIPFENPTPAKLLQYLLEKRMVLKPGDQDLVVMRHEVIYHIKKKRYVRTSTLTLEGDDAAHTAMAQTVGLPLAFMTELLLTNPPRLAGVHIPTMPEVYIPVLKKLSAAGIKFKDEVKEV